MRRPTPRAVLGRLATYSGKEQTYEKALAMDYRLMPEDLTWESMPPVLPNADGQYLPPMPAKFKIVDVTKMGQS